MVIPNFITHYYRAEPFQSITSVSQDHRPNIINTLNENNTWGLNRFHDPEYLKRRLEVEKELHKKFLSKGGKPTLKHPIYCFLGRNEGFESNKRNKSYLLELNSIPIDAISFTYGDSMLAFDSGYKMQSGEKYQNPLCTRLFLANELEALFSHIEFPENNPLSIEAQLWIHPLK